MNNVDTRENIISMQLIDYKTKSIDKLNNVVLMENYNDNEQNEINSIIQKYTNKINDTNYISDINNFSLSAKYELLSINDKNTITYNKQWSSVNGNKYNMPITNALTPKDGSLLWSKKIASSWVSAPTLPIIIDDYLYVAYSNTLIKYDKKQRRRIS